MHYYSFAFIEHRGGVTAYSQGKGAHRHGTNEEQQLKRETPHQLATQETKNNESQQRNEPQLQ